MMQSYPTVLLIEDHEDLREGIKMFLRNEGYAVETAANGREAMSKLYAGLRPGIIITDLMMPGMNGYEFRQQQMDLPEFSDIPVIVYSGITDAERNASQLNAAAYLEKPFHLPRLVALVRKHCLT